MSVPATAHASAVVVGGHGVLIRGASGSGKSSLVLGLIDAQSPPAMLVADDRVRLSVRDGLRTWTVLTTALGLAGFALVSLVWAIVGAAGL